MPVVQVRSESEFKTVLAKAGQIRLVVVDFTAKWCGPCQRIAPDYERLSDKYRQAVFLKVDVDECQEIAMSNDVKAMPTFLFIKGGSEVDRIQGADPAGLENKIKSYAGPAAGGEATFEGSGQRLGGPGSSSNSTITSAPLSSGTLKNSEEMAQAQIKVDESKPTTKVSIRLADGNKLSVRCNLSQPVSTLREFICNAVPNQAFKVFSLMTTFPNNEISDETLTIEKAKLANSVVMQKMK